jgi:tetratricopeptide (TPR) repeat protein
MQARVSARALLVPVTLAAVQCAPPTPHTPALSGLAWLQARADSGKEVPRPRLPAGADTNSASAYYDWGTRWTAPIDSAEMALFWASRLDPSWAEPLFARYLNMFRALRRDAFETFSRTRSARSVGRVTPSPRQLQVIDSLRRLAWERNPFMISDLEFRRPPPGRPDDPLREGWLALSVRNFAVAESLFAIVVRQHPEAAELRLYRARALFYLGRFDDVVAELEAARDTVRRGVEEQLSAVIPSVEMFDFAIGIARVQQENFPAARAAFERALTQNLAFYWGHTRLAGSALALGDTATALAEMDMAIQLEERDPVLRFFRGVVLKSAGRRAEAEQDLRQAIALDPYFAQPYYWLAVSCHERGDTATAVENYRQYLRRAARDATERPSAVRGMTALGAIAADST